MARMKPRDVEAGLENKGFTRDSSKKKHRCYVLWVDGRKEGSTFLSHNSPEIDDNLLSWMAEQLGLRKPEFIDLLECPLSTEKYLEIRKAQLENSLRILKRG